MWKVNKKDFIQRISFIMKLCELDVGDIQLLTGISGTNISSSITGERGMSDEVALQYIQGLHIRSEWLNTPSWEGAAVESIFEEGWVIRHSREEIQERLSSLPPEAIELSGIDTSLQLAISSARKLSTAGRVSIEWLLYGLESEKDYPIDDILIRYLKNNPEARKRIWEKSREVRDTGSLASRLMSAMDHVNSNPVAISRHLFTNLNRVYRYLKGEERPGKVWLEDFAHFFGVDVEWLEKGGEPRLMKPVFRGAYTAEEASAELKALRERLNLTQKQMAEEVGIARPIINRIEKGTYPMSVEFVERVREVYDQGFLRK